MDIKEIVKNQREYFTGGQTLELNFRMEQLKKLKKLSLKTSLPHLLFQRTVILLYINILDIYNKNIETEVCKIINILRLRLYEWH